MMKKSLFTACTLLAACSSMQMAEPVEDSITPLEQACMGNPLVPERWERLARSLQAEGLKTVRLSNMRPFVVPVSRIEYPRDQQKVAQALGRRLGLRLQQSADGPAHADLRIVLGRDYRDLK